MKPFPIFQFLVQFHVMVHIVTEGSRCRSLLSNSDVILMWNQSRNILMKMTSLDNKCNMFKCSSMASLMSSRLSPCLPPPVQPISRWIFDEVIYEFNLVSARSRCSSLVLDKCDNDLSCGSISPIPPSCRTPASINKDIKIFVTDMMNNNNDEVFANLNNDDQSSVIPVTESETMLAPRTVSASCLSRSSLTTSLLNTSLKKSHLLVLTWATVSTAALGDHMTDAQCRVTLLILGTCVGLALALTSLDVGISVASLGVAIILFVIFLSYRVLKTKSRRSGTAL